jgi:hypothetical protein
VQSEGIGPGHESSRLSTLARRETLAYFPSDCTGLAGSFAHALKVLNPASV